MATLVAEEATEQQRAQLRAEALRKRYDQSGLHATLDAVGAPMLDLSFFPEEQHSALLTRRDKQPAAILNSLSALQQLDASSAAQRRRTRPARLRWSELSDAEAEFILLFFADHAQSFGGGLSSAERDKVKALPVFRTVDGARVSIGDGQEYFTIAGDASKVLDDFPVTQTMGQRFLATDTVGGRHAGGGVVAAGGAAGAAGAAGGAIKVARLLQDLQVTELSDSGLIHKFLLPEFDGLSGTQQHRLLLSVRERWPQLRTNDAVKETLKGLRFLPVAGVGGEAKKATPGELLDPRVDLFSDIFEDDPSRFPQGEYVQGGGGLT